MKKYESIIQIAADSVDKLRTVDVFRTIETADGQGCLKGFVDYLRSVRPDLEQEITDCIEDL